MDNNSPLTLTSELSRIITCLFIIFLGEHRAMQNWAKILPGRSLSTCIHLSTLDLKFSFNLQRSVQLIVFTSYIRKLRQNASCPMYILRLYLHKTALTTMDVHTLVFSLIRTSKRMMTRRTSRNRRLGVRLLLPHKFLCAAEGRIDQAWAHLRGTLKVFCFLMSWRIPRAPLPLRANSSVRRREMAVHDLSLLPKRF
ncbi:hypothetical protein BX600DRAFT_186071 [Xylariales sp. PMI_506]|nr:hypothetical protein BX600DRAFT_186071 [Xylariales sp. PMI_506]